MRETSDDLDAATNCVVSDPERSLALCEQYLNTRPDDPRGLFCRFQALDELGEFEGALADINRVLEIEPGWLGYFARGTFFHKFGHYERAVEDLSRAGDLDTEGSAVISRACYRASALSRLGRLDEALADCTVLPEDHWMPGQNGLPVGNKQEFIEEIKRRAAEARSRKIGG
jgi:tetratricopeptide (TPR) repeat protein